MASTPTHINLNRASPPKGSPSSTAPKILNNNSSSLTNSPFASPNNLPHSANDTICTSRTTAHCIAISRADTTIQRFATCHAGLLLCIASLTGPNNSDDAATILARHPSLSAELRAFDFALRERHAEARLLWHVLGDMRAEEWFGRGGDGRGKEGRDHDMVGVTLRRLGTLRGLEESLRCWEGVVLELCGLVDGEREAGVCSGVEAGEMEERGKVRGMTEWEEEVRRVVGGWRKGLPGRP
ncbi:hypothetical protein VTK26DRAFT_8101 [Humicola hyalothermophila]